MKTFKLQLAKVKCISESSGEWGKDEITLIAFGITKRGTRFALRKRSLGSFGSGDATGAEDYPKVLAELEVPDSEDGVSICAWLVERDGGQLSLSTSEEQFMSVYETGYQNARAAAEVLDLDTEGRNMYAFAQAMMGMQLYLVARAGQTDRDDDVYRHVFQNLGATQLPGIEMNSFNMEFVGELRYTLTFQYKMAKVLVTA